MTALARFGAALWTLVAATAVVLATAAIAWPLLLLVLLLDLACAPLLALRRRPVVRGSRRTDAASIVVVSWNGRHFLERLLPSLLAEVDAHGGDHQLIVVDNGSTDGSVEWLQREYPRVEVVALPENRFFVRGIMAGVAAATRDLLVFLNNDMVVQPGFLGPLLAGFRDPRVFGVAAEVFFRDPERRREETGRTRGEIRGGWLRLAHVLPSPDELQLAYVPTFWAGGGSSAFDRRVFLELGGFDHLFDPFYLEDTGLSYLAWKRGFDLLFTSRSRVVHEHRGTSRKVFGDRYIDNVIRRNQHLFLWRHLVDPRAFTAVLGLLPLTTLLRARRPGQSVPAGLWFELAALGKALPRLPLALGRRCADRRHQVRSDREVQRLANSVAAYRTAGGADLGRPAGAGLKILVLSTRLPRLGYDGSWTMFHRLVELARRHRITLFAFVEDEAEAAAAAPLRQAGLAVMTALRTRNPMPGNLHHRVPWRLWRDYSAPAMREQVVRVLEGTDFDLVQVEYIEMAHLVRGLLPAGVRAVYVCHESLALAAGRERRQARGWLSRTRAWFRWAQANRYETQLLAGYDAAVCLSPTDQDQLRRLRPALPTSVHPLGIDLSGWPVPAPAPAAPPTIAFVGYYRHHPNVAAAQWLVTEVLPLVRAAVPSARVELIGREAPPSVTALAGEAVVVRGPVADLGAALAAATVVALPIHSGSGMRGKLLEAWAAGRAVVATPVAVEGAEAVAGEHYLLAADAAGFAAALVRCLQDEALRERLGRAGRQLAQDRYGAAAFAGSFEAVYRRLLGGAT